MGATSTLAPPIAMLNFVVTGQSRSGAAILQSALDSTPSVVCHGDLFFDEHGNTEEQIAVRREAHESYFGACRDAKRLPEWMMPDANPCRYLSEWVWDNPRAGETKIGVKLMYHNIDRFDLYDVLESRCREGDFCLVHVLRNPVACFVSQQQAKETGVWRSHASNQLPEAPMPVCVSAVELTRFVHHHHAVQAKIRQACPDALEVSYRDLCLGYRAEIARVKEFLELPLSFNAAPSWRRLRNTDVRSRISNYTSLRAELPSDVRAHLDKDLF